MSMEYKEVFLGTKIQRINNNINERLNFTHKKMPVKTIITYHFYL